MKTEKYLLVEGKGELNFFKQLLKTKFQLKLEKEEGDEICTNDEVKVIIKNLQGIDSKKIRSVISLLHDEGRTVILIIDADTPEHKKPKGGCENRKKYLEDLQNEFKFKFDFFIIPNDKGDGNLETLLGEIIGEQKGFYNCLDAFIECLKDKANTPPKLEGENLNKIKLEWYAHNTTVGKPSKQTERDYKNDYWDFNSPALEPLIKFLSKQLGIKVED